MNRILELDYIKGIAMIMVLMGHVIGFCLRIETSPLFSIIIICEMPLFFAVSGFLMPHPIESLKGVSHKFLKRTIGLLVPMVVWSFILNILEGRTIGFTIFFRGGYWFFLALWWCNLIYFFVGVILKKFSLGVICEILINGILCLLFVFMTFKRWEIYGVFPTSNMLCNYPFFAFGVFLSKYKKFFNLCFNKKIYAFMFLILILGWYFSSLNIFVINMIASLAAVIVIWMICKDFNHDSKISKVLGVIGRNTLPIYATHYLFLLPLPSALKEIVDVSNGFIFQFVVSFSYAILIIVFCLSLDRIISKNSLTRIICFGELKKRNL